jgi:protein-S-isoprenylcysteine O-methyltransferase Ste14
MRINRERWSGSMGRRSALLYGVAAYAVFLVTILYAIGFVSGVIVPKTIDTGPTVPVSEALGVNLLLLSLFAIQHSGMARQSFKQWLSRIVPRPVERSTYVLVASCLLLLLFYAWRPMPAVVWQVAGPAHTALMAGSFVGWGIVFLSTFLINHFELFGLNQVIRNLTKSHEAEPRFRTPFLYKFVRHPLYLGFIVAFWCAPVMTVGHLFFAVVTTVYIFVGIMLEERDLVRLFGDEYRHYRQRVAMLIPFPRKSRDSESASGEFGLVPDRPTRNRETA